MQTGKLNNVSLMEQLDRLPLPAGSSFKKEAAWERLHDRLQGKKRKQRRTLLLAGLLIPVAASLFYFLFVPINHKLIKESTKDQTGITQPTASGVPVKKTGSIDKPAKKDLAERPAIKRKDIPDAKQEAPPQTTVPVLLSIAPSPDTVSLQTLVLAPPVVKKKLKVVHNNELGDPLTTQENEKNAVAVTGKSGFLQGLRRSNYANFEEIPDDTIRKQKPKRSLLPFSSIISQKE